MSLWTVLWWSVWLRQQHCELRAAILCPAPLFESAAWFLSRKSVIGRLLGPVVRKPISANPGLSFHAGFFSFLSKAFSHKFSLFFFKASNNQFINKKAKRIYVNLSLKLPNLNLNFALTLAIRITALGTNKSHYHSTQFFLPSYWLRAPHVTCKWLPTDNGLLMRTVFQLCLALCLAANDILLMRKWNHAFLPLAIAFAWKWQITLQSRLQSESEA